MAGKKAEIKPDVETREEPFIEPPRKPRPVITMASESGTTTVPIKTTRELYMEIVDNEKN